MKKVFWLAVQPTPYNKILYTALKGSAKLDFQVTFSLKTAKDNPYEEKYYDDDDYFFNETAGIDLKIVKKAFYKDVFFVIVGWNNKTKLLSAIIRSALGLPFAIWTDSVKPDNYKKRNAGFFLKRFICRRAAILFTTGNFGVQKMIESGLPAKDSQVVSLPFFVELPSIIPQKNFNTPQLRLLQLCRMIEGKGVEISIEAFSILKQKGYYDIYLSIGGTGANEPIYKQLATKYGVNDQVTFEGWINAAKLKKLREETHLLIHPVTRHDPFPLVVLESFANGIPVIGSSLAGSVAERVKNGQNGFIITPGSATELAEKIIAVYNDRQLLKKLATEALQCAREWPVSKGVAIVENALSNFMQTNTE